MNKIFWLLFFSAVIVHAQNVVVPDSTGVVKDDESIALTTDQIKKDTVPFKRFKAEGISAVVGEYIILDTDIDKGYLEMKSQGISVDGVSRCQIGRASCRERV